MPHTSGERREEVANALTHGFGALVSAVGGAVLIALTARTGDGWRLASAVVYCSSLVLLFGASTSYHWARNPRLKRQLEIVDHAAIFGLIAGTYTPFMLVTLRGGWGWSLFTVIWALAVAGICLKLFFTGRWPLLSTLIYIVMGWLVVVASEPMLRALPPATVLLLVAGGLAYTGGTVFFHSHRLPYAHTIWHLFVLGGSACHFAAVASQLVPALPA